MHKPEGSRHEFVVRVPSAEFVGSLKAYATTARAVPKELTDLYNLLSVANSYVEGLIGARTLDGHLHGTRLDTGRLFHDIAGRTRTSALIGEVGIPLVALIRRLVTDLDSDRKPGQAGIRWPIRRVCRGLSGEIVA